MVKFILALIGYKVVYVCDWGTYSFKYDSIDRMMDRPCHPDMGVAPPWAKLRIVSLSVPTKCAGK